jgi:hypothetical protein
VRFLAAVEATGTGIVNCPEYVRIWITAENEGQRFVGQTCEGGRDEHSDIPRRIWGS